MANYPNSAPAFTTRNNGDVIDASHPNEIGDEVTAIGTALIGTITHALTTSNTITSSGQPRAGVYNNAAQSVNDATNTALTFNTEDFDVGAMHDTGSNTSRLTIPASAGGLYWVSANSTFATNGTGYRQLFIRKNGTTNVLSGVLNLGNATTVTQINCSGLLVLSAADYLEVMVFQTSGGALNVGSATREFGSQFQIVKLW